MDVAPEPGKIDPRGQDVHPEAPVAFAYVPAGHFAHVFVVDPTEELYWPAGQLVQGDEPRE